MENAVIESQYPLTFRKEDATKLGEHLMSRNSVVLIGMKRVGISSFLRFFLNHKEIPYVHIKDRKNHLFIPVDLNDLVEKEIFPFWTLTLKRIADTVEKSRFNNQVKKNVEMLFLDSIQSQDLFLTIDRVRRALVAITAENVIPTLFFLRFDRVSEVVTPEFFANLQGILEATNHQLSYVFTSFRNLDFLAPRTFPKASLSTFSQNMFIKPAYKKDTEIIFETYKNKYKLQLGEDMQQALFDAVDGYVQYLQLALILLSEKRAPFKSKVDFFDFLLKDERISSQSEELFESLTSIEQQVLLKISNGKEMLPEDKKKASYLWDTGFVVEKNQRRTLFSPLFDYYLKQREEKKTETPIEFTKKEHLLFSLLSQNRDEVCEREKIVEHVWPEVESFGVSDWAIDRLIARVRSKLRIKKSMYEIQTVKTRGYKLILQH